MSDSPLSQYIGTFYTRRASSGARITPFSICFAPVPYFESPRFLRLTEYDHKDEEAPSWEIVKSLERPFSGSHDPIKALNLEAHEEFMVFKAKKRPCITIAINEKGAISQNDVQSEGFRAPTALVIPIYDFYGSDGRLKYYFTKEFVKKVSTFHFRQLFFIPDGGPFEHDGFARLDRMFSARLGEIENGFYELGTDARLLLEAFMRSFLNNGDYFEFDKSQAEIIGFLQGFLNAT